MAFRTQFLHFDSSTSNYITDVNNSTTITSTSYKTQYPMNQVFQKIKRIYLKSLECPVGFSNIRTGSTNVFSFIHNGTPYNVTLAEKNCTSIQSLLYDLTTACIGIVSGVTMTFSLTSLITIPNRVIITFTGSTTTSSFSVVDSSNLSKYILGFRASKDILSGGVYAASYSNYNLNPDNYISMYIPSFNGMNASMSGQQTTFKIPLNSVTNQVYFYQEQTSFAQWVDITDQKLTLSSLTVILADKYGKDLNPNGLDYSFTLALELWQ